MSKEYEIWSEGYSATGEHGRATFHGKSFGNTFDEAIENFRYTKNISSFSGKEIIKIGDPLTYQKSERYVEDKDSPNGRKLKTVYTIWNCRYFDNETDARKSFG